MFAWITLVLWLANLAMMGLSYLLYRPKRGEKTKPVEQQFKLSAIKVGTPIPVIFGEAKVGGLIIEWGDWTTVRHEESMGKK